MKKIVAYTLFISLASVVSADAAPKSVSKVLEKFCKQSFPGQQMIANGYGGDERYTPKNTWVYVDLAKNPKSTRTKKGWILGIEGDTLFPKSKVKSRAIDLPQDKEALDNKFLLALNLAGDLGSEEVLDMDAVFKLAKEKDIAISVNLPKAQIESVPYLDLSLEQAENLTKLQKINDALKLRWGDNLPKRKVITTALKVQSGSVSISRDSSTKVEIAANSDLAKYISKAGLKLDFSNIRKIKSELVIQGEKYLCHNAVTTSDTGLVSESSDPTSEAETTNNVISEATQNSNPAFAPIKPEDL